MKRAETPHKKMMRLGKIVTKMEAGLARYRKQRAAAAGSDTKTWDELLDTIVKDLGKARADHRIAEAAWKASR